MNRSFPSILILALALVAGGRVAAAAPTNAPASKPAPVKADAKLDFQSFKLISERNIFDRSRSGRTSRVRSAPVHVVKVDSFALSGTMSYEKGQFAFFDGSSSEYRKTLKPGDAVAGYKVTAIDTDSIQLLSTNNQIIKMPVGMEMSRRDGGPWSLGNRSERTFVSSSYSSSSSASRGSDSNSNRPSTSPAAGQNPEVPASVSAADDVIKRLMEKRAKEESGK